MGTKNNPTLNDCYAKAEDDEPVFVLLARDPWAPGLARLWSELRGMVDASGDKSEEASRTADAMEHWASEHPDHGFKF